MFLNEILKIDYVVAKFKCERSLLIIKMQRSYLQVLKEHVRFKKVRRICTQIYCLKYYVFNNCVNRVSTPPKNPTDQCPLADKLPIDKNIALTAYMQ